jgi:hypothetical protein
MLRPIDIKPLPDYRIWLKYSHGIEGVVDLSQLAGKGVFKKKSGRIIPQDERREI